MKNKEKLLVDTLLGEDNNFCKLQDSGSSEISSWISEDTKSLYSNRRFSKNYRYSSIKLEKILEDINEPTDSPMINSGLSKNTDQVRYSSKLSKPVLNEFYMKLSKRFLAALNYGKEKAELCSNDVDFRPDKKSERKEERSRSVKHRKQEPDYCAGHSFREENKRVKPAKRVRKEEMGYKRFIYFKNRQKSDDTQFLLLGKGDSRSKSNLHQSKSKISHPSIYKHIATRIILPEIRSKSTISSLSLYNSGVPLLNR